MSGFLRNCPTYLANGLMVGCLYALIAMGFNIIYSSTGVINFAQGEFAMLGALLAYQFTANPRLPLVLAILISLLLTALVGIGIERAVIFPLRKTQAINMIIATIGVSILLKAIARIIWPEEAYNVPPMIKGSFTVLGVTQRYQGIWVVCLTAASVMLIYFFFRKTMTGKAMRACSANRKAASLTGINVSRMSMYAFALSAALAAAAGFVNAPAAYYGMGLSLGISGFTAAVVGGLGNPFGAVLGGLVIGVLESVVSGFLQVVLRLSSGYGEAVIPLVLIAVLLFMPNGMLGRSEKIRV